MKKLWLVLLMCLMCNLAFANQGIFEKGYCDPEQKEELFFVDSSNMAEFEYDIVFCFEDTSGKEVDVSLSEIYKLLRMIAPQLSDRSYRKAKEFKKDTCPVCGSEERLFEGEDEFFLYCYGEWYWERGFYPPNSLAQVYICADCGNVYAAREGG